MKRTLAAVSALVVVVSLAVAFGRSHGEPFEPVFADAAGTAPTGAWTVEVTYVANEGVLITSGDTQVVIDGLFRQYKTYPYLPPPHRDQIEGAAAPYSGVDLILVSHIHGDHYHPQSVARHMHANPGARLVSSQQVIGELQSQDGYAALASRVTTVTPAVTERVSMAVAGVQLDVIGLGHGTGRNGDIQNLGHVITFGGKKFLHVGDAVPTAAIFGNLNLDEAGIDVAFLPMWFLTDGAAVVREHIRPKHIIAVHMSTVMPDGWTGVLQSFPGAVAFTRLLEKRYY